MLPLEQVNVKIGNVLSDVFGVSGQRMLLALLNAAAMAAVALIIEELGYPANLKLQPAEAVIAL